MAHDASRRQANLSVSSGQLMPGDFPRSTSPLTPNTSKQLSLTQAVHARRAEYTTVRRVKVKIGTWNVAALKGTENDIGNWFVKGLGVSHNLKDDRTSSLKAGTAGDSSAKAANTPSVDTHVSAAEDIDLYVLGLQEVVDINSAIEALRPSSDAHASKKFKQAMEASLPDGYRLIADQQLIGLLLLVYASPNIAQDVHSVSTTSVGTGLMGYMGNKGAVVTRIVLGEQTRLVFVNSHMSAGVNKADLERRNWDFGQIVSRARFEPVTSMLGIVQEQPEKIGDEDFAFWFGDLNYRLEGVPGDDIRRLLTLHTNNMDGPLGSQLEASNGDALESNVKSGPVRLSSEETFEIDEDPASLQTTLASLLPHDELHQMQKRNLAFHDGWREGQIKFLPTYKYDMGTVAVFDTSEKRRAPSWCDRILFRSKQDRLRFLERRDLEEETRRRDEQMRSEGLAKAAEAERTMFEYDPDADGEAEYNETSEETAASSIVASNDWEDENLRLESYASHQRITSADHKPLDAVFALNYDATDEHLKSRIQQDVARELDKAENEGRPVVTVVVDGGARTDDSDFDGVSFGAVRFDEPKTRSITLANTGRVPALVGFLNQARSLKSISGAQTLPEWLSITFDIPSQDAEKGKKSTEAWDHDIKEVFRLAPGDTATAQLLALVTDHSLLKRHNGGERLEGILVLRVKDGRDHFIPVRGKWQASSYGRTLDNLIRVPEGGVRALPERIPDSKASGKLAIKWSAPREIFRLTEAIETMIERIIAEWSMLGQKESRPPWVSCAGWPFVQECWSLEPETRQLLRLDVNEALDTDKKIDDSLSLDLPPLHRVEVLVDVLLSFLGSLEDRVIDIGLWTKIEEGVLERDPPVSQDALRARVLEVISTAQSHSVSFILITTMLSRTTTEISTIYAPPIGVVAGLPTSPRVRPRRRTLDKDPIIAARQLIRLNVAAVFADVLFGISDKTRWNASQSTRRELVEAFMEGG